MLYGFDAKRDNDENKFHQRVADQNIQGLERRQDEIQRAKNGFIGMLAGIVVGGMVGWLFLGPSENLNRERVIPIVHRPMVPAKVQPNDPGGMEIENQNREIYHIVDNTPKPVSEVNIVPVPDMPQLVVEKTFETPDNIENLVESLEEDGSLKENTTITTSYSQEGVKVADSNLLSINTNSKEKIAIPQKIKDIDVKLQNSINSQTSTTTAKAVSVKETDTKQVVSVPTTSEKNIKSPKGTWYAQIIASSSRKTVENLWNNLSSKNTFLKNYVHEIEEISTSNGQTLYRLKVGAFKTRKEAETLNAKLKQNQISSIIKQN